MAYPDEVTQVELAWFMRVPVTVTRSKQNLCYGKARTLLVAADLMVTVLASPSN
jgi:hypothetical protein